MNWILQSTHGPSGISILKKVKWPQVNPSHCGGLSSSSVHCQPKKQIDCQRHSSFIHPFASQSHGVRKGENRRNRIKFPTVKSFLSLNFLPHHSSNRSVWVKRWRLPTVFLIPVFYPHTYQMTTHCPPNIYS